MKDIMARLKKNPIEYRIRLDSDEEFEVEDEEFDVEDEETGIYFEDYDKVKGKVVKVTPAVAKAAIKEYINEVGKNIEIFDKNYIDSKLIGIEMKMEEYLKNRIDRMTEKIMKQVVEREFKNRVIQAVNDKLTKINKLLENDEL